MPFSVCPSSRLFYYSFNSLFAEVRYFLVLYNFLGSKNSNLISVLFSIFHCFFHVHFIAVAAYPAPQCRMHMLYRFKIACCDKHKVARHWLCPYHCACAPFTLACNRKLPLLKRRQKLLLG